MSSDSSKITYVNARCHCSSNRFKIPFLTSTLPQATELCHCSSCRHTTGYTAVHRVHIHGKPLSIDSNDDDDEGEEVDLSNLCRYNVTPSLNRYFCRKCGAYLLYEAISPSDDGVRQWSISTGALERTEGIVQVGCHTFVGDTNDGGFANHYRRFDGVELPRYSGAKGSLVLPIDWEKSQGHIEERDYLKLQCHCKTIQLHVVRLKESGTDPRWLFIPKQEDEGPIKYLAGYCVCTDCTLTGGSSITSWLFAPREYILDARTSLPVVLSKDHGELRPEGLKQYESSPNTYREFCGNCGAKIAGWAPRRTGRGGEGISLPFGLVDEGLYGGRARGWCTWMSEVFFEGDAVDKRVLGALLEGLEEV